MELSEEARGLLEGLQELYVQKRFPNHKAWWFSPGPDQVDAFAELRAHGYIQQLGIGRGTDARWMLTDFGLRHILRGSDRDAATTLGLHHHGDVHMGSTFTTNITGSTVGAVAVGDHATATGTVHVGADGSVTQAQHDENIKKAKKALVDDEGLLDELVHEAFTQFLTLARKIQVEQQDLAQTQAKMKETLDEVWAAQASKGMKPQLLPKTLEVVKVLVENPVMGEVVKGLSIHDR